MGKKKQKNQKPMVNKQERIRVKKENQLMRVRKKMWDSSLQQNIFQNRKIPILTIVENLRLYRCGQLIKQSISRGMILMKTLIAKEIPAQSKQ